LAGVVHWLITHGQIKNLKSTIKNTLLTVSRVKNLFSHSDLRSQIEKPKKPAATF